MDLSTLSAKVQASRLLSAAEKTYWLENLPRMNGQQLQKLESILAEAENLPWNEEMQNYLSIAAKAQTAFA
jgi:hypothetical protein